MFVPVEIQAATHNKKTLRIHSRQFVLIVHLGNSCFPSHMKHVTPKATAALVYVHAN